jgi:uncharacterized membrane protein
MLPRAARRPSPQTPSAPAGALGDAVARLLGDSPAEQLREDLGRLKQALEQGPIDPAATPG